MGEEEGAALERQDPQDPQFQLLVKPQVSLGTPVSSSGTMEPEILSLRPQPQEVCTSPTRWRGESSQPTCCEASYSSLSFEVKGGCCAVLSRSAVSNSLRPHGLKEPSSPLGYSVHGDSPSQNTGMGCHALLQGIFPTQASNPDFPYCRWILNHLSHQGTYEYWTE